MSEKTAHPERDFSRFDMMSTEELKELLYQDSLLTDEQESDMDAILYIMEVVTKREAAEHPENSPSAEDAWKSFNELYRSDDCDVNSLYADDEEDSAPTLTVIPTPPIENSKPRKSNRHLFRVACIAAVLVAILLGGSLTAQASWENVWASVAQWTKDLFGFSSTSISSTPESLYSADNDPRDTLQRYGITENLVPKWMPDGYYYVSIEVREAPNRLSFYICYSNEIEKIGMTIAVLSSSVTYTHEKTLSDALPYPVNGADYFIMENLEETTIAWTVDRYECSIGGNFSTEDAKMIIESIYRS